MLQFLYSLFSYRLFLIIFLFLFPSLLSAQYFWTEQNSGVTAGLNSVSNIDAQNAWAAGVNGTVIKTTNYGYNWSNVSGNGIPSNLNLINIYGLTSNIALTAGYIGTNTYLYLTTNGGLNWTQVFTQPNGFVDAVWMNSAINAFMVGDPVGGRWSLWKTTNGGLNWDSTGLKLSQYGNETGLNNSLFMRGNRIWFGTDSSRIYYSSNGGSNWINQSTAPETNINSIFIDTVINYGFSAGSTLLKTTNSGTNWVQTSAPGSGIFGGIIKDVNYYTMWWYIRSNNNIYNSMNSGNNWSLQYTAPSGNYTHLSITKQFFSGSGLIYAVRNNGGISRCNFFVEGVTIVSGKIPDNFTLKQNYPNPFNASTIIEFDSPKLSSSNNGEIRGSNIKIIIYDALGREVGNLVNEVIQPGTYKIDWNGNNYPSGIYFYRLIAENPGNKSIIYSQTKKMVLLK